VFYHIFCHQDLTIIGKFATEYPVPDPYGLLLQQDSGDENQPNLQNENE
jgi:hypothetical protein